MRGSILGAVMALAAAALYVPATLVGPAIPMRIPKAPTRAVLRRSTASPSAGTWGYPQGPGWSYAHVKRMARKARNVKRNRRAQR